MSCVGDGLLLIEYMKIGRTNKYPTRFREGKMNEDSIKKHLVRMKKLEEKLYEEKNNEAMNSLSLAIDIIEYLLQYAPKNHRS